MNDSLDKVRAGAEIKIHEGMLPENETRGFLLKEGDVIRDWVRDERAVVGKRANRLWFIPCRCKYCATHMHILLRTYRSGRRGRDGAMYYTFQTSRRDAVCPLCDYVETDYRVPG